LHLALKILVYAVYNSHASRLISLLWKYES